MKDCNSCKYYKRQIKSVVGIEYKIIVCTGEGQDDENCRKYDNYRSV